MAGIYIHIPFCKQACYYCDFHFSTSLKKKDDLVKCIVKELQFRQDELADQLVETIYFGGGTPSLLSEKELATIISTIYNSYKVASNPEITLEANPDDLSEDVIKNLKENAINRLSIGIQSFFEEDLKAMNRAHDAKEAVECLEQVSEHFNNITIDLIYGIPDMSLEKWTENLERAFSFNVVHISSYALTVEPKTALASFIKKGKYHPINDEQALHHFKKLVELTEEKGYVQYEISNFGKEGYFSKHNTNYWKGKPYLGIGPSAHSYKGMQRSWNVSNNSKYIDAINKNQLPSQVETLSVNDQFNEYIMTGLRTIWGVDLNYVYNNFGSSYKEYLQKNAKQFIDQNLLQLKENSFTLTNKGKFLADGIAAQLFMI